MAKLIIVTLLACLFVAVMPTFASPVRGDSLTAQIARR